MTAFLSDPIKFKLNTLYSYLPGSQGILTHAGRFHADELLSIALMEEIYGTMPIIRSYDNRVVERFQALPNWWVLDIGKKLDFDMKNVDHHQDRSLPATNLLLLERHKLHFNSEVYKLLKKYLFQMVSDIDTGNVVLTHEDPALFNTLVRWCNSLNGANFFSALNLVRTAFKACLAQCKRESKDVQRWKADVVKKGHYAIIHSTNPVVNWEALASEEGICYMLKQDVRIKGWYSMQSIDSKKLPIPKIEEHKQPFLHASGFLATYASLKDAEEHVKTLPGLHPELFKTI